jgi:hypothetical protein
MGWRFFYGFARVSAMASKETSRNVGEKFREDDSGGTSGTCNAPQERLNLIKIDRQD